MKDGLRKKESDRVKVVAFRWPDNISRGPLAQYFHVVVLEGLHCRLVSVQGYFEQAVPIPTNDLPFGMVVQDVH